MKRYLGLLAVSALLLVLMGSVGVADATMSPDRLAAAWACSSKGLGQTVCVDANGTYHYIDVITAGVEAKPSVTPFDGLPPPLPDLHAEQDDSIPRITAGLVALGILTLGGLGSCRVNIQMPFKPIREGRPA
jgi:hypothetical protein